MVIVLAESPTHHSLHFLFNCTADIRFLNLLVIVANFLRTDMIQYLCLFDLLTLKRQVLNRVLLVSKSYVSIEFCGIPILRVKQAHSETNVHPNVPIVGFLSSK